MRLTRPFLRLPVGFCAETLAAEVKALPASAWVPHPQGFAGNEAVRLVAPEGLESDGLQGPMGPTDNLRRCPYIMEVMAELGAVWGRARLMGLGPGADVPRHVDNHYYWRTHLRIHIPVITNPEVEFTCDGETIHMSAGDCWLVDTFRPHGVRNGGSEQRVHLVLDTVGGERLWELVGAANEATPGPVGAPVLQPGRGPAKELAFERINVPKIMSPWEIKCHIADLLALTVPDPALDLVRERLDKFATGWSAAWARFGTDDDGLPTYRQLIESARQDLRTVGAGHIVLRNGRALYFTLDALLFTNAVAQELNPNPREPTAAFGKQRLAS